MSVSEMLRPDGSDYDLFLQAEVGEDRTGAAVTVLSALARLGLEPWTEARELAQMGRDVAQVRLTTHLSAIKDIPALGGASSNVATKLVSLLPERSSRRSPIASRVEKRSVPGFPIYWILVALLAAAALARLYILAHTG